MPDVPFRVDLLKKMHLFHGIGEAYLTAIAQAMEEDTYEEDGKLICRQGTKTDFLYIIYDGAVTVYSVLKGKENKIASLFRGDYFGEQSLINNNFHNATVRANRGTIVLKLPRKEFVKLLRKTPNLKRNFTTMIQSRSLARKLNFPWLNENEVIYYISRIHYFWLLQKLFTPTVVFIVFGLISAFLFIISQNYPELLFLEIVLSSLVMVAVFLWGIWRYIDWTNDYHIITNQRVIHITRTIAIYDFRSEIRMDMIMSVTRDTNFLGRLFRFGTVIVRTLTGEIMMTLVRYPHQMVVMIEEYKARTKDIRQVQDERAIKDAIRKKIGLEPLDADQSIQGEPAESAPIPQKKVKKPGFAQIFLQYLHEMFDPRKEVGGTVTYHKHWIALWRTAAIPTIILVGLFIAVPFVYRLLSWDLVPLAFAVWIFVSIGVLLWWGYEFWDWRNDIYQITPDQILAIHRKPLGDEDRKAASLDNILSINYERRGIIELLLSYGTVKIQVGNVDFSFIDVSEPANVQNDIQQRITQYRQRKQEAQAAAERDRMAEWLAMYHKTMGEIDQQTGQTRDIESG
jgi:hypothetical protein